MNQVTIQQPEQLQPQKGYADKIKKFAYLAIYVILSVVFFFRQNFKMSDDDAKKFEYAYMCVISILMFVVTLSQKIEQQLISILNNDDKLLIQSLASKIDEIKSDTQLLTARSIENNVIDPPYGHETGDNLIINKNLLTKKGRHDFGDYVISIETARSN